MLILDEQAIDIVNKLFEKLAVVKPAFKQAWPTEREFDLAKREWVIAFKESGINSIEKLKRGISHFRMSPQSFIPSPGEFIAMCRMTSEDIKAPNLHAAYEEALLHDRELRYDNKAAKWSHPCVKYAYEKSDPLFLRSESHKKTFAVFKEKYEEAIEMFADGRIMQQLEHKKPTQQELQDYHWYINQTALSMPASLAWIKDYLADNKKPS